MANPIAEAALQRMIAWENAVFMLAMWFIGGKNCAQVNGRSASSGVRLERSDEVVPYQLMSVDD